jgi:AAA domain-containing protein
MLDEPSTRSTQAWRHALPIYGPDYVALSRAAEPSILKDLIPVGGLANLYGATKAGKSYAALQLALAVSGGLPHWFGIPIMTHGPVEYIQLDTGRSWWLDKYVDPAVTQGYNIEQIIFDDMKTVSSYPFNILGDGGPWLKTVMKDLVPRPILVIIDNIRDAYSGDENDSGVIRNVITTFRANVEGAAILFLTHGKKPSQDVPMDLLHDTRGSSVMNAMMDGIMKMWSTADGKTGRLYYQSRAIPLRDTDLVRRVDGYWELAPNAINDDSRLAVIISTLEPNLTKTEEARQAAIQLVTWQGELLDSENSGHVERIRKAIGRRRNGEG